MLEELNTFLSSSTIHGLAHIPASRRLWRLFWILIVTAGFTVSTILIWMSFCGWRETPISTTIAIKPITELMFPNITVCPPRKTMTELNHHLELVREVSLTNQTRQELRDYFYQNLLEIGYDEMWRNLSLNLEKEGLRKWYLGQSQIVLPYYKTDLDQMFYYYNTFATSGEVTTPLYGQPWNISNFDRALHYQVRVHRPWKDNERKVSIVFQLEQDILTELTGKDEVRSSNWQFHRDDTNITIETLASAYSCRIFLDRLISGEEAARIRRNKMPGMRVKWYYNDTTVPVDYKAENKNFVRLVNILHLSSSSLEEVWLAVREAKYLYIENISKYCLEQIIKDSIVSEKLDFIEAKLGLATVSEVHENVTDRILADAGEMYVHLIYCHHQKRIQSWLQLYPDLLTNYSAKSLILTLSGIVRKVTGLNNNKFETVMAERMLRKVWSVLELPPLTTQLTDQPNVHHPVHLIDEAAKLSPSALIPFCDFGGDLSWVGQKVSEFDLPVCNSFRKTLLKGQLCYSLDVNQLRREQFSSQQFRLGLTLLLDYNEDRMISHEMHTGSGHQDQSENNLVKNIVDFEELQKAYINIDTLSMFGKHFISDLQSDIVYCLAPIELYGEGHYALGNVKEIKVTSSYLNMDRAVTGCQDIESPVHCNNRKFLDQLLSTCKCFPPNLWDLFDKGRLCEASEQACVDKIPVEYEDCLPLCEGLSITNFDKDTTKHYRKLDEKLKSLMYQYNRYKNQFEKPVEFPANLKEFRSEPDLHVVRIYFDTPTFDRITKDERAKFEVMLSTVGGTLGLLTGFSVISGVEIVCFVLKFIIGLVCRDNLKD